MEGDEIQKHQWAATEQLQGCKYSLETVNNTVITTCGARWVLGLSGGHFVKYDV